MRRHAEYFRGVFETALSEWETRLNRDWPTSYGREIANMRAALDWAFSPGGNAELGIALTVAAIPLWFQLSSTEECRNRVEQAIDQAAPGVDRDAHAREVMQLYMALGLSRTFTIGLSPQASAAWRKAFEIADILGMDLAGVVEAAGSGVTAFGQGDTVYGLAGGVGGLQGSLAEFAAVDADLLAPTPPNLSLHEAAAIPLVFITAWEGLVDRAGVQAHQKVLVQGVGGVGHMVIPPVLSGPTSLQRTALRNKNPSNGWVRRQSTIARRRSRSMSPITPMARDLTLSTIQLAAPRLTRHSARYAVSVMW
jgi:hypothetical protein